ncbi:MAG: sigma-E processing peptidase SpoIIGA [Cellulosilyticaceae bacterium]
MQVIYIDVLFILNLAMDCMIFWLSYKLMGYRIRYFKLLMGSAIAAFSYCMVIVLPCFDEWPMFVLQLLIPITAMLYLYRPRGIKEFIKVYCVCTLTACVIGGVSFSVYFNRGKQHHVTPLLPIGVGVGLCILLWYGLSWVKKRLIAPYFEYEVYIGQGKNQLRLMGYLDTGNRLYTITDHQPVMISSYRTMCPILTVQQRNFLEICRVSGVEKALQQCSNLKGEKYYLIPFHSVGCPDGILIGISVKEIAFKRENWCRKIESGVIAIQFDELFNNDVYEVLIHPEYVKLN